MLVLRGWNIFGFRGRELLSNSGVARSSLFGLWGLVWVVGGRVLVVFGGGVEERTFLEFCPWMWYEKRDDGGSEDRVSSSLFVIPLQRRISIAVKYLPSGSR